MKLSLLLAPAVGVLGVAVGAWFQSHRERRSWLRDKRYEAYASFFNIALELALHLHGIVVLETEPEITAAIDVVGKKLRQLGKQGERIRLIAPDDLDDIATETIRTMVSTYLLAAKQLESPTFDFKAWVEGADVMNTAITTFLLASGKDLGLSRLERRRKARGAAEHKLESDKLRPDMEFWLWGERQAFSRDPPSPPQ